jgi:plastocyanin
MKPAIPTLLAVLVLAIAGCGGGGNKNAGSSSGGGSSSDSGSGGGEQLSLAAPKDGALKFDKETLSAKAGKVTINFDNPSQTPHAVEIEGNGVEEETDTVTGGKASVSVDLKAGKYEFYCPVGNHRQAGMEGTLTVQ